MLCDKLATVVGHQFITQRPLCVQREGSNAARRADLRAAAENHCIDYFSGPRTAIGLLCVYQLFSVNCAFHIAFVHLR